MAILEKSRRHWVTVTMYVAFSLFFLGACIVSAATYGSIGRAQQDVELLNPEYGARQVPHGAINISFSVQIHNPSRYTLHVNALSWYATLVNSSSPDERIIPLGDEYIGPTRLLEVPAKGTTNFSFGAVVSDPSTLAKLYGYLAYETSLGANYTITTLPYTHSFSIVLLIGEFEHDYLRERYLNDLVTIRLSYSNEGGAA